MKKAVVAAVFSQPWKILPIHVLSTRKVRFDEKYIVEFHFKSGLVILSGEGGRRELAKLASDKGSPASVDDFRGKITGKDFCLSITSGWFLGSPSIALKVQDNLGVSREIKFDRVQLLRDFDFDKLVRCHFLDGREKLEIAYKPEMEDVAQVVGAVLLHLLIAGGNTRGVS